MKQKLLSVLLLALFIVPFTSNAQESESKKVVYDVTTGDLKRFESRLVSGIISHTSYYQSKLEELETIVVVHGDAYKFFMKDLNNTAYAFEEDLVMAKADLQKRLSSLSQHYDVKFLVCEAGVKSKKLNVKVFYPFVSFVHNSAIGLIDAQNDGYAYLPIN